MRVSELMLLSLVVKKKPVTENRTIAEEVRSEKVTVKGPDGKNLEEKS